MYSIKNWEHELVMLEGRADTPFRQTNWHITSFLYPSPDDGVTWRDANPSHWIAPGCNEQPKPQHATPETTCTKPRATYNSAVTGHNIQYSGRYHCPVVHWITSGFTMKNTSNQSRILWNSVRLEILSETLVWDVMLCHKVTSSQHFKRLHWRHLQGLSSLLNNAWPWGRRQDIRNDRNRSHIDTASNFKTFGSYYNVLTVLNTKHKTFITNTQCFFKTRHLLCFNYMCIRKKGRIQNHSSNNFIYVCFPFPLYTYPVFFFFLLIWMWENEPQRKPHSSI